MRVVSLWLDLDRLFFFPRDGERFSTKALALLVLFCVVFLVSPLGRLDRKKRSLTTPTIPSAPTHPEENMWRMGRGGGFGARRRGAVVLYWH